MYATLALPLLLAVVPASGLTGPAGRIQDQFESRYLERFPEHSPPCSARRRILSCEEAVAIPDDDRPLVARRAPPGRDEHR